MPAAAGCPSGARRRRCARCQNWTFAALDALSAVVFIHPAELPGPTVPGVPPWGTDFLLDTTRAAFLLVRNGIRHRFPNIRFILSHAGGFVPYASHRMALAITAETGRSQADSLDEFSSFYFDTALSSSAVRAGGRVQALRRGARDIPGHGHRHPQRHRPRVVPTVRHRTSGHSFVADRVRSACREPGSLARGRTVDESTLTPSARWLSCTSRSLIPSPTRSRGVPW